MSQLQRRLEAGCFVITAEIAPPKGPDLGDFLQKARLIRGRVVAINVTDNQRSMMRLSSLVASARLAQENIEPIFQLACRDRNRLALQSDLLGAAALGIENLLPLTGDGVANGDQKEAKAVFDLTSVKLMGLVQKLNAGLAMNDKELNGRTHFYVGGAVDPENFGSTAFRFKFEEKLNNGAKFFQSQPVYDLNKAESFYRYCVEVKTKILLGVLLIKSAQQASFLNEHVPGIRIPASVIQKFADSPDALQVGIDYAAQQIAELKPFCHGIHIMTVGREDLVPQILDRAGLDSGLAPLSS